MTERGATESCGWILPARALRRVLGDEEAAADGEAVAGGVERELDEQVVGLGARAGPGARVAEQRETVVAADADGRAGVEDFDVVEVAAGRDAGQGLLVEADSGLLVDPAVLADQERRSAVAPGRDVEERLDCERPRTNAIAFRSGPGSRGA